MTWSEELNYRNSAQKAMSIFVGCLCFALLGFSDTEQYPSHYTDSVFR